MIDWIYFLSESYHLFIERMDNNSLEQKQNFLRKEILEAGYDGG